MKEPLPKSQNKLLRLRYVLAGLLFLLHLHSGVMGQKTDKVYLKNGDILTGEIKSMKLAKLNFDMDGPGVISIKWEQVVQVYSTKIFEITFRRGTIVVSPLDSVFFAHYQATLDDLVDFVQIKDRLLARLRGDLNIGFSYTKSNGILQLFLGGQINYKIPKLETGLKINSVFTAKNDGADLSKKQDVTFSLSKDLTRTFYLGGNLAWQQNTELGLANRFLINFLAGLRPIIDNHNRMVLAAGISTNLEQPAESALYSSNLDAIATAEFKRFYYSTPKFNLDTKLTVYPGLSDWGRVRVEYNLDLNFEIIKDFALGVTFYDNYDSRPPQGAFSSNDFGVNFNLTFSFGQ